MGLRFYRDPEEVDAENAAAAKVERTAALNRSTIRREASLRPGRDQIFSASSLSGFGRQRSELAAQRVRERVQAVNDARDTDAQIEALEYELALLRRARLRSQANRSHNRRGGGGSSEQRRILQDTVQRMSADESLRHHWQRQPSTQDEDRTIASTEPRSPTSVNLPPPSRESGLRFEIGANSTSRPSSPGPADFMPSPPSSAGQTTSRRPIDGPLEPWNNNAPLTEGFAPARAARTAAAESTPTEATAEVLRITDENSRPGLETPPPEAWYSDYPPLRRVSHMSPQPLPRNAVDGLGDRRTSPSPSETYEEETWNHLLATMHERARAEGTVSQTSSFIAPTVVLDSNNNETESSEQNRNQSQNGSEAPRQQRQQQRPSLSQASSMSFGEIGVSAEDSCDPPPGITEEQVRLIRERHRRTAGSVRPASRMSGDGPRRITHNHWPTDTPTDRALAVVRRHRSLQHSDTVRERQHRQRERDLMLEAILLSYHRSEDIPDEWWALAGLPNLTRSGSEL